MQCKTVTYIWINEHFHEQFFKGRAWDRASSQNKYNKRLINITEEEFIFLISWRDRRSNKNYVCSVEMLVIIVSSSFVVLQSKCCWCFVFVFVFLFFLFVFINISSMKQIPYIRGSSHQPHSHTQVWKHHLMASFLVCYLRCSRVLWCNISDQWFTNFLRCYLFIMVGRWRMACFISLPSFHQLKAIYSSYEIINRLLSINHVMYRM